MCEISNLEGLVTYYCLHLSLLTKDLINFKNQIQPQKKSKKKMRTLCEYNEHILAQHMNKIITKNQFKLEYEDLIIRQNNKLGQFWLAM